jgi:hypothetical protein
MPSRSKLTAAPGVFQDRPRGKSDILSRDSKEEVMRTYSATKPKNVVFRITAFCHLFIDRFQISLWVE